jgi:hypothetical protein
MAKSEVFTLQHSDLNGFLFSIVGSEPNGMTLNVVSLLGRLGVDPWGEAGRLATLPRDAAKEWLAQTIASSPTSIWSLPDANVIAARLITLLPNRVAGQTSTAVLSRSGGTDLRKSLVPLILGALAAAVVCALLAQLAAG